MLSTEGVGPLIQSPLCCTSMFLNYLKMGKLYTGFRSPIFSEFAATIAFPTRLERRVSWLQFELNPTDWMYPSKKT